MSNIAIEAAHEKTGLIEAALSQWSNDPRLSELVAAGLLVLDGEANHILHASDGALMLRSTLADPAGRVRGALALAAQIERLGPLTLTPRIARLRFDARGIALPMACRVARAPYGDGKTALLVAPLATASMPRAGVERGQAERQTKRKELASLEPSPAVPAPIETEPTVSSRLVWRSDGSGVLTHVSGSSATVTALLGRPWAAICARAENGAGGALLAALRERRTFRTLPLILRVPGVAGEIALEVSGAPSDRASGASAGFAGFAMVRERIVARGASIAPESEISAGSSASSVETSTKPHPNEAFADGSAAERALDSLAGGREEADRDADRILTNETTRGADPISFDGVAPGGPGTSTALVPSHVAGPPIVAENRPHLSIDERAAFREIARALGARFPRDDRDVLRATGTGLFRSSALMAFQSASSPAPSDARQTIAAVLDLLPAGLLVHRDDTILFANRRLLDLTGFADLHAVRTAGGVPALFPRLEPDGQAGAEADAPAVLTCANGANLPVLVDRAALSWDGRPAAMLTVRPQSKAKSFGPVESDAQTMLDRPDERVVILDASGHVLSLNPQAAAILGEEARGIIGKRLASLSGTLGTTIEAGQRRDRDAQGGGQAGEQASETREVVAPPSEGSATPLRVRISRLLSAKESPLYATLQDMARDMTDAERSEDEAAATRRDSEATRRRLAFFARAGHDIRAPLDAILGVADAMLEEPSGAFGNERYRDNLRDIRASGSEALGLLDDLVAFAEIEAGRSSLAFVDVTLNDLVSRCIAELQPHVARRKILLRTSLAEDVQAVHADERSMRYATVKVLSNAIRLTEAGGQIIVSTAAAEQGEIALRVRDTGSGLSPDEIDRALDPFHHARMPGSRTGAELGLTLTKALVEANRGQLRITSRKDEGTLVEMVFRPVPVPSV